MKKIKKGRKPLDINTSKDYLELLRLIYIGKNSNKELSEQLLLAPSTTFEKLENLINGNYIKKEGIIYQINLDKIYIEFQNFIISLIDKNLKMPSEDINVEKYLTNGMIFSNPYFENFIADSFKEYLNKKTNNTIREFFEEVSINLAILTEDLTLMRKIEKDFPDIFTLSWYLRILNLPKNVDYKDILIGILKQSLEYR